MIGTRMCAVVLAVAGLAGALAAGAAAHGERRPGLTEREMRAWETRVLGPRHAAEHAALRRLKRRPGERARAARTRRARPAAPVDPAIGGRWNGRFDIPVMGINAALLPTGKVLWYAYPSEPDSAPRRNEAWAALWDPSKGTGPEALKRVDPPIDPATGKSANIWCSGTSLLADGRVLVTGGNLRYVETPQYNQYAGLNQVYTFNPYNETWTRQPDMAHGRWYPSQLLMPDGRTLILQGLDESSTGEKNRDVEVFTPSPNLDGVGTIANLGELPLPYVGDYYPHTFWMPSGRGLIAGPFTNDSFYLTPGASAFDIADVQNLVRRRVWGSAVLEPGGPAGSTAVLELGGSDTGSTAGSYNNAPATATSERFDETDPEWRAAPSLKIARSHLNTVLLPDGSIVTVGGGVGSDESRNRLWTANDEQRQVELWDPVTREWRLGASQLESRAYHSTALLLPDGRVLSAGDDRNGGFDRDSAELYEPPYLHKGPRPRIASMTTGAPWDTEIDVATPDGDVTGAALVAPGAVTHAVDMNQRYVPLSVVRREPGRITVRTPPSPDVALPGHYMLFLLNERGVPSVARWIRLRPGAPDPIPAPPEEPGTTPPAPIPAPAPGAAPVPAPAPAGRPARPAPPPTVRARIVRRRGRRVLRVTIGRSPQRTVRVKLELRDRRRRVLRRATRTLPSGATRTVTRPAVPTAARSVRVRLVTRAR